MRMHHLHNSNVDVRIVERIPAKLAIRTPPHDWHVIHAPVARHLSVRQAWTEPETVEYEGAAHAARCANLQVTAVTPAGSPGVLHLVVSNCVDTVVQDGSAAAGDGATVCSSERRPDHPQSPRILAAG